MMRALRLACVVLVACGGSDEPNFGPETAPTASQQAAITSVEQSLGQLAGADTQGAAAGAAALSLSGNSLLLFAPKTAGVAPSNAAVDPAALAALRGAAQADCAVVSSTSITWTKCVEGGFTFDGTVSWSPGHVDMNLHMVGTAQDAAFEYTLSGAMTASASAIQSDFSLMVSATVGANRFSEAVHSHIDIQIAQGCITGGTMTVTATGSGAGSVTSAVQIVWTGCHAFRVRNA